MLCYTNRVESLIHVVELSTGNEVAAINIDGLNSVGTAVFWNGELYVLSYVDSVHYINRFSIDGTALATLPVPTELTELPPDPSVPDHNWLGATSLCVWNNAPCLTVVSYDSTICYSIDFNSNTFEEITLGYTITWEWVSEAGTSDKEIAYTVAIDGMSVKLSPREMLSHIDEAGNIYTYHVELGEYRCYSKTGQLLCRCPQDGIYSPRAESPSTELYGGDGCLYFIDWTDEGYLLIRVKLNNN